MKRFAKCWNNTDYSRRAASGGRVHRTVVRTLRGGLATGLVLTSFAAVAQVDNNAAAARENARRQMESFSNRMRRGHERGQQRALDTNERVRRERERQIERLDDLRRQRSR